MTKNQELDQLCVNTIRFLAVDMVQKANSGHPGLPLGAAPMAYTLWDHFLKFNPRNPRWFDRDRFVLSAGHGSALLYALLYLTGYDLSLRQIEQFRQWDSKTPGHPEYGLTPGVETTTGPLGQGFGNGVGMAIAEAHLAARYNRPGFEIVNHHTYGLVSDGDLMEGVASEAASLAGHLKLGKLIYLYDDNRISLASSTDLTFTEDRARRFEAYGWHTQTVEDGNDLEAVERALEAARNETERPSLILVRTHIGYGSPHKQDTFEAHGSPLGEEYLEEQPTPEVPAWVLPFQAVRALLWTAVTLPVIRAMKGRWWETGLAVALLFSVLMGGNLLQPTDMPTGLQAAHFVEVFGENFVFGWVVVGLLSAGRRPALSTAAGEAA
jgi:transketolase